MKELKLIQEFESVFIEAGKLAMQLQKGTLVTQKHNSGYQEVDILTEADLIVQEYILKRLAKSDLVDLELVAEENTPTVSKFSSLADLVMTIDPIDGTSLYVKGRRMYSIIVSMHDKKKPLYSFVYFPEVDWGVKLVEDDCHFFGEQPSFDKIESKSKIIVYSKGNPAKQLSNIYDRMLKDGYVFVRKKELTDEAGSTALFLLGLVDGIYVEDGSAVDCLVGWHYGITQNYFVYTDIDLSKTAKNSEYGGDEYAGIYLVVNK